MKSVTSQKILLNLPDIPVRLTIKLAIVFLGIIVVMRLSMWSAYVLVPLVGYALTHKKTEISFWCFMLIVTLSIINEAIVPKGFHFYMATRGCLFLLALGMTIKAASTQKARFLSPFNILGVYVFYMMFVSIAGWCPIVSELKATLFLIFILALIKSVGAVAQTGVDIRSVRSGMVIVAFFVVFGSIAVIPFPGIGRSMLHTQYMMAGTSLAFLGEQVGLFNGVTWHSQTLGPTLALLNAFLLSDYLCNLRKKNPVYLALMVAIPILIYMTSSRTAFFAYLISVISAIFFFMKERHVGNEKKTRVLVNLIVGIFVIGLIFLVRPGSDKKLEAFLAKTHSIEDLDSDVSVTEALMSSRMGAFENGIANFKASPLFGNGFQVSKEMMSLDRGDSFLILSAPIEKGILPVMVLEEGGIIGAVIFLCFIIALYTRYQHLHFTCFLSTFTVFLVLNSGEAIFFSTSGGGGILWMTCFCGLLVDIHRQRRKIAEEALLPVPMWNVRR